MHSVPSPVPTTCYICEHPARIEPGRNSYLVNCEHCGVRYEIDLTAWATPLEHRSDLLAWVRGQQAAGHEWPYVTKQTLEPEDRLKRSNAG